MAESGVNHPQFRIEEGGLSESEKVADRYADLIEAGRYHSPEDFSLLKSLLFQLAEAGVFPDEDLLSEESYYPKQREGNPKIIDLFPGQEQ